MTYQYTRIDNGKPIKHWTNGVAFENEARIQVENVSQLPFIFKHIAIMPDVHWGMGATIGSVIPIKGAIIPAAVGVDIGCGMMAVQTSLNASNLPDNLSEIRLAIEAAVPHGRTDNGGINDRGSWGDCPEFVIDGWNELIKDYYQYVDIEPKLRKAKTATQLGTLGGGNHFIELCLDESGSIWIMLHSGSRGIGNAIGRHYIQLAKKDMERWFIQLPDKDLAYFPEGSSNFKAYVNALNWAQKFARINRELMMQAVISALNISLPKFDLIDTAINCHHNYVQKENHFGSNVWLTRKGAVSARKGQLGIIPGSMGAKSFIVEGKGNPDSFNSCSHGAGRTMSRRQAKKQFTIQDHIEATEGVECKKDESVLDETPGAYKIIDDVMAAQDDLVVIKHTLKQVVCVKG